MRTTLALDDDVLAAARHLAEREQKSLGEIISKLARQGLSQPARNTRRVRHGIPLLQTKKGDGTVTLEIVNRLRDEQS